MLETGAIKKYLFKVSGLTLLGFVSVLVNFVEITLVGIVLAGTAMFTTKNYQILREYLSVLLPIMCIFFFLISALLGFFTVEFMSKLARQSRAIGAIIVAVTGATTWIAWSAICLAMIHPTSSTLFAGCIANALSQLWVGTWIMRKTHKVQFLTT